VLAGRLEQSSTELEELLPGAPEAYLLLCRDVRTPPPQAPCDRPVPSTDADAGYTATDGRPACRCSAVRHGRRKRLQLNCSLRMEFSERPGTEGTRAYSA
jgi:hypothetical protein